MSQPYPDFASSQNTFAVIQEIINTMPVACIFSGKDILDYRQSIFNSEFEQLNLLFKNKEEDKYDLIKKVFYRDFCPTVFEYKLRLLEVHSKKSVFGTFFYVFDQTDRQHLETIRTDFITNLAHELRTPLTSLSGALETIRELNQSHEEKRVNNFIDIALRHSNRLGEIFDNLSLLSDIERGRAELITEEVSFNDIIETALDHCISAASAKNISLCTDFAQTQSVQVNRALMVMVLTNLILNGIKFSDPDSKVLVKCWQDDELYLKIAVQDWGKGIPYEHQDRIFERFYRNDYGRSRVKGGSGLGLALVKHIVKAHQGRISVDSKENEGSTFTIEIPRTISFGALKS